MRVILDNPQSCSGCTACVSACRKSAISLKNDGDGFWYPIIDELLCIDCGLCSRICPANKEYVPRVPISDIAAYSKDHIIRESSSSGGVFSELARATLHKGGVVFGAAFDTDLSVHHICVDKENDLEYLRGSKYLQSRIENSFVLCKKYLDKGNEVLFSGTPCQIRGLRGFLQREYDNLITVDFICHGVPSPLVWQQYLLNKQRNFESKITNASFRDKEKGWKNFNIKFFSKGCDVYSSGHDSDPYMRLFLSDVILRPSCYSCHFKEGKSGSDITLADFWGIDRIFPDKDDDKGVNLLMINTERGQELMDLVNPKLMTFPVSHEEAVRYNTSWYRSVSPNPKRKRFFKEFRLWRNFDKRTEKLLNNRFSLFDKVRRKAASYIKSLIGNK